MDFYHLMTVSGTWIKQNLYKKGHFFHIAKRKKDCFNNYQPQNIKVLIAEEKPKCFAAFLTLIGFQT